MTSTKCAPSWNSVKENNKNETQEIQMSELFWNSLHPVAVLHKSLDSWKAEKCHMLMPFWPDKE